MIARLALTSLLLAVPAAPAAAQGCNGTGLLLRSGDVIDGQTLSGTLGVAVDDSGSWATTVLSDGPLMLVRDRARWLRVGDPITQPPSVVTSLYGPTGGGANLTVIASLNGTAIGLSPAILRDRAAILVTNQPVDVVGLPPGTLAGAMQSVTANEHGTVMAVVALGQPSDQALLRFTFAPDGTPLTRTRALRVGDPLPGGSTLAAFARAAINEHGDWLMRVTDAGGGTHLVLNGVSLVASGSPSPVPGRPYAAVLRSYDLNDHGDVAAVMRLSGDPATDLALVRNGALFVREGDPVPSGTGTMPLADIGQVRVAASSHLYWQALRTSGDHGRGVFLRDGLPILEDGVSVVEGELVTAFEGSVDNFEVSPSGRFFVARVELATSGSALVCADLGASWPIPGCTPSAATLRHTNGLVLAGSTVGLMLDGPVPIGTPGRVTFALARAPTGTECGIATPFGEVLLDPGSVVARRVVGVYAGQPLALNVPLPASLALVGVEIYAQGAFGSPTTAPLLSNGVGLEIGAP